MLETSDNKATISIATAQDRKSIYQIRHEIYSTELGQHIPNLNRELQDDLDLSNHYIVAKNSSEMLGFISITSPTSEKYSVDKYFRRSCIPFPFDNYLYEIRLLSVNKANRNSSLAFVLMYAAFRWIQAHGGRHVVAICRAELLEMYRKAQLRPLGIKASSGNVVYELAVASITDFQKMADEKQIIFKALEKKVNWKLPYSFFAPAACYHGGSFFEAIGEDLQTLEKAKSIINADVLDAWFPPSPTVLKVLQNNLSWLLSTSPPTHANGFIQVIANIRGIKEHCILPGAGSSDLIFLALPRLLKQTSKVLILDPCYGEYFHVLEKVIQCKITRFKLNREEGFKVNTAGFLEEIKKGYDLVIIVNPNSPTGVYLPKEEMKQLLFQIQESTLVWIDETYIEFAGANESLEQFAVSRENVIICKSMSKVYALSGVRAAYLCCSSHMIESLKPFAPPWSVSLPAQAAAITALYDPEYYQQKYAETHVLCAQLKQDLKNLGITDMVDGVANFLLFYLPSDFPPAPVFLKLCKEENLYLREVSNMGESLGSNAVRIAVKDEATNKKMIAIMKKVLAKTAKATVV